MNKIALYIDMKRTEKLTELFQAKNSLKDDIQFLNIYRKIYEHLKELKDWDILKKFTEIDVLAWNIQLAVQVKCEKEDYEKVIRKFAELMNDVCKIRKIPDYEDFMWFDKPKQRTFFDKLKRYEEGEKKKIQDKIGEKTD